MCLFPGGMGELLGLGMNLPPVAVVLGRKTRHEHVGRDGVCELLWLSLEMTLVMGG